MQSTMHGVLPLSSLLSNKAQSAFALDNLRAGSLVSLAQLCIDDCFTIFNKYNVCIVKDNEIINTGTRIPNKLWSKPIKSTTPHQINSILCLNQLQQELATYHHAALGSQVPSTLLSAIRRGHLTTFPGLTTKPISKHLPKTIAKVPGLQDQEAKHLRSIRTTTYYCTINPSTNESASDLAPELAPCTHQLCAMLFSKPELLKSYSNQMGQFPVPSSRGKH